MKRYLGFVAFAFSLIAVLTWRVLDITRGTGQFSEDPFGEFILGLAFLAFPAVGSIIVLRQPGNAMGWIFSGIGLLLGAGGTAQVYAEEVLPGVSSPRPIDYAAAWVTNWWWYPLLGLVMIFATYLFPTGRSLSPRWRIPFLIGGVSISIITFIAMTTPRLAAPDHEDGFIYTFDNPIGIDAVGHPEKGLLPAVLFGLVAGSLFLGVISLVVRFKRSRGAERQQMKWFALGALLLPLNVFVEEAFDLFGGSAIPFAIGVGALPVSAGIAILRYRLYEIDVVINRALVYGSLTAILGGLYVGLVFAMQAVLAPVTAESDLAVAGSTLAVAALFRPVRSRVQQFIDHRFYRRKFNAQQTLDEFSSHLRDEVDLAALSSRLEDVVNTAMQPAHVSLWLKQAPSQVDRVPA